MMSAGKRKRDDFPSQYRPDGYIPQQDGAGDVLSDVFKVKILMLSHNPSNCQLCLETESLQ